MKKKKRRRKRHTVSDRQISRIAETIHTALQMAEKGLRPTPLEIEDMFEYKFTGEMWETSWHFADHLLLLSIRNEERKTPAQFDVLMDEYELAMAIADIPIIAHLDLQVTPIDTLPSDDVRFNDIPDGVPLWHLHSPDFQEHPDETCVMLFLSTKKETDDDEQDDSNK